MLPTVLFFKVLIWCLFKKDGNLELKDGFLFSFFSNWKDLNLFNSAGKHWERGRSCRREAEGPGTNGGARRARTQAGGPCTACRVRAPAVPQERMQEESGDFARTFIKAGTLKRERLQMEEARPQPRGEPGGVAWTQGTSYRGKRRVLGKGFRGCLGRAAPWLQVSCGPSEPRGGREEAPASPARTVRTGSRTPRRAGRPLQVPCLCSRPLGGTTGPPRRCIFCTSLEIGQMNVGACKTGRWGLGKESLC